jgi:ferredoxin-thioredoxin reductase catalytic subunit
VVGFARIRRAEGAAPSHGGLGIADCPGRVVEDEKQKSKATGPINDWVIT